MRARFWMYCYIVEIALGGLVAGVSWHILYTLDNAPAGEYTGYEAIMLVLTLMILFVITEIMFNTAQARASAAEILDKLSGGDDGKR